MAPDQQHVLSHLYSNPAARNFALRVHQTQFNAHTEAIVHALETVNLRCVAAALKIAAANVHDPDNIKLALRTDPALRRALRREIILLTAMQPPHAANTPTSIPHLFLPEKQFPALILRSKTMTWMQHGPSTMIDQTRSKLVNLSRSKLVNAWRDVIQRRYQTIRTPADSLNEALADEALDEGWEEAIDVKTGRTYYYSSNGETSWDRPSRRSTRDKLVSSPLETAPSEEAEMVEETNSSRGRGRSGFHKLPTGGEESAKVRVAALGAFLITAAVALF